MNALKPRVPKRSCHQRIFISKLGNLIKVLLKVVLDLIYRSGNIMHADSP